jgi:predicted Zn-dependent protease
VRTRDLVPLALLAGIAGVIVVQGREMGRKRKSRSAAERVTATAAAPVAQPQGAPALAPQPATAQPAPRKTIDVVMPAELRASEEPPPVRDDAVVRQQIRDNESGTYIRAILDQQEQLLVRWPQRQREALRVWIERDANVADWDASYPIVAENVFSEWKEAGFPLRFDIVTDRVGSDIQIRWVSQFSGDDSRRIGLTSKARDQSGWLVSAEITVATHGPDGQKLTSEEVAGVARHEIGHALGLGHSASRKDVMYPESTTSIISEADRATLHLLYMLPPGVVK